MTSPIAEMDGKNVVDDNQPMSLSCNTDAKVVSCVWRHMDPITEQQQGSSANVDLGILCSSGNSNGGSSTCADDSRITFRTGENTCAIDVTSTKPEDTGKWYLSAVTISSNGQSVQEADKQFEVYTYNMSLVELLDEDKRPETRIQ